MIYEATEMLITLAEKHILEGVRGDWNLSPWALAWRDRFPDNGVTLSRDFVNIQESLDLYSRLIVRYKLPTLVWSWLTLYDRRLLESLDTADFKIKWYDKSYPQDYILAIFA